MSLLATTTFTAPDPDVQPATYADAVEQLNSLVTTTIPTEINTFIMGIEVPAVEDQDKPWLRINTINNPVGWYIFTQGVWVREEPAVSARLGIFTGDPTLYFNASGAGLKGAGPIAGDYWGWHLLNGLDGVPNWSNRFLIMGAMDNDGIVGYDANWRTVVNGEAEATGGVAEIMLDADNTYFPGVTVGTHDADGQTPDASGNLYGTPSGNPTDIGTINTEPIGISVVPPFIATAMIIFTGYLPE